MPTRPTQCYLSKTPTIIALAIPVPGVAETTSRFQQSADGGRVVSLSAVFCVSHARRAVDSHRFAGSRKCVDVPPIVFTSRQMQRAELLNEVCTARFPIDNRPRNALLCNAKSLFPGSRRRKPAMELREALSQISEIRQQMARSEVFRGYRSMTVGFSGVLGLLAAAFQSQWVASPESELGRYLCLWISVAAASLIVAGAELCWRARGAGPGLARQMTLLAVGQFLPCVVVGALLTLCIYRGAPQVAWMLPGLWSLVFGLGVFASYRLLPRQVFWVGLYYVLCGCGCLLWGQGDNAFSPWQMGISFGGGQLMSAAILYWTLERSDVSQAKD